MVVQHLLAFIVDGPAAWPLIGSFTNLDNLNNLLAPMLANLVLVPGRNLIDTAHLGKMVQWDVILRGHVDGPCTVFERTGIGNNIVKHIIKEPLYNSCGDAYYCHNITLLRADGRGSSMAHLIDRSLAFIVMPMGGGADLNEGLILMHEALIWIRSQNSLLAVLFTCVL